MLYIGIDLGTSACKLLLVDESGQVKNTVAKEYPLSFPRPGWSEQDPALVAVQRGPGGKESGVPCGLALLLDVAEPPALVGGDAVVAVAQQALELGVPVEAVAAHSVGDEAEKRFVPQVVDPGQGRSGGVDDVLLPYVIEVAEFHRAFLLLLN